MQFDGLTSDFVKLTHVVFVLVFVFQLSRIWRSYFVLEFVQLTENMIVGTGHTSSESKVTWKESRVKKNHLHSVLAILLHNRHPHNLRHQMSLQWTKKSQLQAKLGRFWAKNPFLLEKSKVLLPT